MNLHGMASGVVKRVNPMMQCTVRPNIGSTSAPGGKRTPTYGDAIPVQAQVQQLTAADLKHMNDMNMSGITRKVWCNYILTGIDRDAGKGGDLLTLPDGTVWLVVQVMETWPNWCSALLQKQVA